jgi:exonuclease SbcC
LILEKLAIEGFKAISAPLTVQFPSSGIIGVIGPNGTGKSTLLEAIEFALFGPARPAADKMNAYADLITWGEEKAKVTLDFAIEQKRYRIQRRITKSGNQVVKLSPETDGSTSFSSGAGMIEGVSEVEKAIETILGIDRSTFTKLLNVKQRDLDFAKDAGRSDRQLFVNKLLGCESFDMAIDRTQKER